MKIRFVVGPAAHIRSVSGLDAFAGFDGIKRTCTRYSKRKGGMLRCDAYKKGRGHPACDSRLKGGGRSPGLIRAGSCKRGKGKK